MLGWRLPNELSRRYCLCCCSVGYSCDLYSAGGSCTINPASRCSEVVTFACGPPALAIPSSRWTSLLKLVGCFAAGGRDLYCTTRLAVGVRYCDLCSMLCRQPRLVTKLPRSTCSACCCCCSILGIRTAGSRQPLLRRDRLMAIGSLNRLSLLRKRSCINSPTCSVMAHRPRYSYVSVPLWLQRRNSSRPQPRKERPRDRYTLLLR